MSNARLNHDNVGRQVRSRSLREVIHDDGGITMGANEIYDMRPDEARAACDQNGCHVINLP